MFESTSIESMSSFEVLQHHHGGLESIDSKYSIIAYPPVVNGLSEDATTNGHFYLDFKLPSATPDLSLEELPSLLADVVEDNIFLIEAVRKNNDMMHQHLSSTQSWHNQLTTNMSKQQLELKEKDEKIKELEQELQNKIKEAEEKKNRIIRDSISPLSNEKVDFEINNRKKVVDESKLKEAEDKISNLIRVIEDQNKEIEILKKSSESVAICKESLQSEELSRSNAFIHQLEKRVEELEESLAVKSANLEEENHGSMMMEGASKGKGKKKPNIYKKLELKQKDELFSCPLCLKGFTSLRAVESSHANGCIHQSEKSQ